MRRIKDLDRKVVCLGDVVDKLYREVMGGFCAGPGLTRKIALLDDSISRERASRNEQLEQAYGKVLNLFGSLQKKLLALEEHLGVEIKWVDETPGYYGVKKSTLKKK